MRPTKLASALVLVVLLSSAASLVAAEDRSHLSSDPLVNRARALIEHGKFGEALSVLRPLAPHHADRTDVLFLVGLAALNASQGPMIGDDERTALLDEAIAAFRAILIDRPELVRVRLELARSFFLKGNDELSREHFERVLAGGPPPAMAANVRRFLGAIRARRGWSGYFGATLAPDNNINAASDADVIHIHGLPFRRGSDAKARSGLGVVLWGGSEYQHRLNERLRLRFGADFARREYAGSDFDQTFVSVHAGPRWLLDPRTELSLLGSARRRWQVGQPYSREHGVRFELEHRLTPRLAGRGRASWHRREYLRDSEFNGPHAAASVGGTWLVTSTAHVDATVGYARERPRAPNWRNSSRWVGLGVSVALPYGFTVGVGGELHWTNYEGRWFPFTRGDTARRDRTRVVRASVFNRGFTVLGFSPKLVLVNETRTSNAQLYDYRRNRVEFQFVRQF